MKPKSKDLTRRERIHIRIRKKLRGTTERPRLAVHFSGKHIYAQVIDDDKGLTLASACSTEKEFRAGSKGLANVATAQKVGRKAAERAISKKVSAVVFDRGGSKFHGKVKALADAAREAGLKF